MNVKIEQQGDVGVLSLDGEVTIMHANELKVALLNSFNKTNHITLNFEKTTAVDLTCLQLLCSAHKTSRQMQKQLTITGCSEPFKRAVADAGYTYVNGCVLECQNNCSMTDGG